jgi:predicted RND superfamily exporter protein
VRRIYDRVLRERLVKVRADLAAQRPVKVEEAPPTLLDRFRERDGTLGRIAAVTARGDARLEEAENLQEFVKAVRGVRVGDKVYDATGDKVIFADLLQDIEKEGPRTTFLSLAGVMILVIAFFRSWRNSYQVVGSLTVGVILMCGVAAVIDLKINFFNFIVFPITFGIAVDYGANVMVRVRERGGDVIGSLAEVGPAVALCSWTTFVGYATLLYSINRALRSFGWYAMIGEVTTILTALVLLPAMLLRARRRERDTGQGQAAAAAQLTS